MRRVLEIGWVGGLCVTDWARAFGGGMVGFGIGALRRCYRGLNWLCILKSVGVVIELVSWLWWRKCGLMEKTLSLEIFGRLRPFFDFADKA